MVKKGQPAIRWDKSAYKALQKIFEYINVESPVNAEKVREGILETIRGLPVHPERYSPDKLKKDNPGNYRAFEKYSCRVAYKHTEKEIKIYVSDM